MHQFNSCGQIILYWSSNDLLSPARCEGWVYSTTTVHMNLSYSLQTKRAKFESHTTFKKLMKEINYILVGTQGNKKQNFVKTIKEQKLSLVSLLIVLYTVKSSWTHKCAHQILQDEGPHNQTTQTTKSSIWAKKSNFQL